MALKVFKEAWRDRVDEAIVSDPIYVSTLHTFLRRLNDPRAHRTALDDVVSQPWGRSRYDWYDAAALYEIALLLELGWCVITYIELDVTPGRDREERLNQSKLNRLPEPFAAWCSSGSDEDDGRLEWSGRIAVRHTVQGDQPLVVTYGPAGVPLEIGHTEPETTICHLRRYGGVARWPYGHQALTLLLCTRATSRGGLPFTAPEILLGALVTEPPFSPASGTA